MMSELNLALTEKFDATTIRAELNEYLKVGEPGVIMIFGSADPPSIISSFWAMLWLGCHLVRRRQFISRRWRSGQLTRHGMVWHHCSRATK